MLSQLTSMYLRIPNSVRHLMEPPVSREAYPMLYECPAFS